jgi:alkanesulfonate monooxygenase SsuD/methylene tetrahydromethanopterin reductase-like flavin-dependent oxidoreductase (luciferase family)
VHQPGKRDHDRIGAVAFDGGCLLSTSSRLASRTTTSLGTAAVIVPWHDPLRVAEPAAVLDLLSKGRLRLGLGRGLARREFAAFRISMDESRERFDEAAPMIVNALKTGIIEGEGKFYQQPRIEIRPRPQHSFDGRISMRWLRARIPSCPPLSLARTW